MIWSLMWVYACYASYAHNITGPQLALATIILVALRIAQWIGFRWLARVAILDFLARGLLRAVLRR